MSVYTPEEIATQERRIRSFTRPEDTLKWRAEKTKLQKMLKENCDKCDEEGGVVTFKNQIQLNDEPDEPDGWIDYCIYSIVAALNKDGVETCGSCCGHHDLHGRIDLEDGRILLVLTEEPEVDEENGTALIRL